MNRYALLKAFLVLCFFWMGVSWFVFSFQHPNAISEMLAGLPPALRAYAGDLGTDLSRTDDLEYLAKTFHAWSLPVLALALMGGLFGGVLSVGVGSLVLRDREARVKQAPAYRDSQVSLGPVPRPRHEIKGRTAVNEVTGIEMTKPEIDLLNAVVCLIQRFNVSAGEAHGVDLLQHTANAIDKAIERDDCDAELLIAVAAHDLGKIRNHADFPSLGDRGGTQGDWSGRILASLDEWWDLPDIQRERVLLAVKYSHKPERLPVGFEGEEKTRALMAALAGSDGQATADEKEEGLRRLAVHEILMQHFDSKVETFPFSSKHRTIGGKAIGWRKGSRLYLARDELQNRLMPDLPPEVKMKLQTTMETRLEKAAKKGSRYVRSPFGTHLLKGFQKRGWLVTELRRVEGEDERVFRFEDPSAAFWTITSKGKKNAGVQFNGVIILDVPSEILDSWGIEQTPYKISVDFERTAALQNKRLGSALVAGDALAALSSSGTGPSEGAASASKPAAEPEAPREHQQAVQETEPAPAAARVVEDTGSREGWTEGAEYDGAGGPDRGI